jgi:uncharacterized protein
VVAHSGRYISMIKLLPLLFAILLASLDPTIASATIPNTGEKAGQRSLMDIWMPLARRGDATAQNNIGAMYDTGKDVPQDYKKAVRWYRISALQGYSIAQFNIGLKFDAGQGVPQNYRVAAKWYYRAAEQGLADAQHNLASMYETGQGIQQNEKEALKWYLRAAAQGLAQAQNNLGHIYEKGRPENRDFDGRRAKQSRKYVFTRKRTFAKL